MKEIVESSPAGGDVGISAQNSGQPGDQPGPGAEASPLDASQSDVGLDDSLASLIEEEVKRRFQSAKDRRWAQLEKQYRDLGTLREDADALLAALETAAAPVSPATAPEDLETRILSLANLPGIRDNEDATAMILRHREANNTADYLDLVEGLLGLTLGQGPEVSPSPVTAASAVIPGVGQASADLTQEYNRRRAQLRPGDINALTALKREFRQKGLDVF